MDHSGLGKEWAIIWVGTWEDFGISQLWASRHWNDSSASFQGLNPYILSVLDPGRNKWNLKLIERTKVRQLSPPHFTYFVPEFISEATSSSSLSVSRKWDLLTEALYSAFSVTTSSFTGAAQMSLPSSPLASPTAIQLFSFNLLLSVFRAGASEVHAPAFPPRASHLSAHNSVAL